MEVTSPVAYLSLLEFTFKNSTRYPSFSPYLAGGLREPTHTSSLNPHGNAWDKARVALHLAQGLLWS